MPLMTTPFHKIAVDLVGPITPVSSQGNRYVDYATRWPEAVTLPSIDTERVAEALGCYLGYNANTFDIENVSTFTQCHKRWNL